MISNLQVGHCNTSGGSPGDPRSVVRYPWPTTISLVKQVELNSVDLLTFQKSSNLSLQNSSLFSKKLYFTVDNK